MYVTVIPNKVMMAHTSLDVVALPVAFRWTVASFYTVITVVTLRAWVGAVDAGVAWRADAVSVAGVAECGVRAAARLRAARAPPARAARRLAARAAPPRTALALASDIMTIGPVVTITLLLAIDTVSAQGTRVPARGTSVPTRALVVAGHRVACVVTSGVMQAALRAAGPVGAGRAGLVARVARPAGRAHAAAAARLARRVIHTPALLRAVLAVVARRALSLTRHALPAVFTNALAGDVVARDRV